MHLLFPPCWTHVHAHAYCIRTCRSCSLIIIRVSHTSDMQKVQMRAHVQKLHLESRWIRCNISVPNRIGSVYCRVIMKQKSSPYFPGVKIPLGQQGLWELAQELPVPDSGSATNWCSPGELALVLKATLSPLKASDWF